MPPRKKETVWPRPKGKNRTRNLDGPSPLCGDVPRSSGLPVLVPQPVVSPETVLPNRCSRSNALNEAEGRIEGGRVYPADSAEEKGHTEPSAMCRHFRHPAYVDPARRPGTALGAPAGGTEDGIGTVEAPLCIGARFGGG